LGNDGTSTALEVKADSIGLVDSQMSIGEFAARAGVSVSALRFYEEHGLVQSRRTTGNQRRFARSDLRRIAFVRAARELGLPLKDIEAAVASLPEGRTPTRRDWQRLSGRWRQRIEGQIADLQALRDRLDGCIGCGCLSLRRCSLYNAADRVAEHGSGPRLLRSDDPSREIPVDSVRDSTPGVTFTTLQ
jgi:MerR family redox-sensitive transcriptional activator SoxR